MQWSLEPQKRTPPKSASVETGLKRLTSRKMSVRTLKLKSELSCIDLNRYVKFDKDKKARLRKFCQLPDGTEKLFDDCEYRVVNVDRDVRFKICLTCKSDNERGVGNALTNPPWYQFLKKNNFVFNKDCSASLNIRKIGMEMLSNGFELPWHLRGHIRTKEEKAAAKARVPPQSNLVKKPGSTKRKH